MSDKLTAIDLGSLSPEKAQEFMAKLVAYTHKIEQSWLFVPSPTEYEKMRSFAVPPNYDKCPKCGTGRIVVQVTNGNMGQGLELICKWSKTGCDFKEYISDD